ncbi:MAG: hypothetical protein VX693_08125 [Pseudomonadota bacterium]|nr:hypothetical protein [Pseudomonadota bacterium]
MAYRIGARYSPAICPSPDLPSVDAAIRSYRPEFRARCIFSFPEFAGPLLHPTLLWSVEHSRARSGSLWNYLFAICCDVPSICYQSNAVHFLRLDHAAINLVPNPCGHR